MLRVLLVVVLAAAARADRPTPPAQPLAGPGAARYVHAEVRATRYGEGDGEYWIFEPRAPTPEAACPVVSFTHGWMAVDPRAYRQWIDHLVRQGQVVIYPRYQAGPLTPPREFLGHAAGALREALRRCDGTAHARVDLERFAVAGHSAGGILAANLAARATDLGLPTPRAVMAVQPGIAGLIPVADLSHIPAATLMLVVTSDRDSVVGEASGWLLFRSATAVARANLNLVHVRSDERGAPALIAHHGAAAAVAGGGRHGVDSLDWWGFWKLFDALCDAAYYGRHREWALGDTPEQRSLGLWSDGTPVREMMVTRGEHAGPPREEPQRDE